MTVPEILAESIRPTLAMDSLGCITRINDAFTEQFGHRLEGWRGRPFTEMAPPPLHHVFFIAVARYVESPQPQMPEGAVRFALFHGNGRLIPVEMQIAADGRGASSRFAVCVQPLS